MATEKDFRSEAEIKDTQSNGNVRSVTRETDNATDTSTALRESNGWKAVDGKGDQKASKASAESLQALVALHQGEQYSDKAAVLKLLKAVLAEIPVGELGKQIVLIHQYVLYRKSSPRFQKETDLPWFEVTVNATDKDIYDSYLQERCAKSLNDVLQAAQSDKALSLSSNSLDKPKAKNPKSSSTPQAPTNSRSPKLPQTTRPTSGALRNVEERISVDTVERMPASAFFDAASRGKVNRNTPGASMALDPKVPISDEDRSKLAAITLEDGSNALQVRDEIENEWKNDNKFRTTVDATKAYASTSPHKMAFEMAARAAGYVDQEIAMVEALHEKDKSWFWRDIPTGKAMPDNLADYTATHKNAVDQYTLDTKDLDAARGALEAGMSLEDYLAKQTLSEVELSDKRTALMACFTQFKASSDDAAGLMKIFATLSAAQIRQVLAGPQGEVLRKELRYLQGPDAKYFAKLMAAADGKDEIGVKATIADWSANGGYAGIGINTDVLGTLGENSTAKQINAVDQRLIADGGSRTTSQMVDQDAWSEASKDLVKAQLSGDPTRVDAVRSEQSVFGGYVQDFKNSAPTAVRVGLAVTTLGGSEAVMYQNSLASDAGLNANNEEYSAARQRIMDRHRPPENSTPEQIEACKAAAIQDLNKVDAYFRSKYGKTIEQVDDIASKGAWGDAASAANREAYEASRKGDFDRFEGKQIVAKATEYFGDRNGAVAKIEELSKDPTRWERIRKIAGEGHGGEADGFVDMVRTNVSSPIVAEYAIRLATKANFLTSKDAEDIATRVLYFGSGSRFGGAVDLERLNQEYAKLPAASRESVNAAMQRQATDAGLEPGSWRMFGANSLGFGSTGKIEDDAQNKNGGLVNKATLGFLSDSKGLTLTNWVKEHGAIDSEEKWKLVEQEIFKKQITDSTGGMSPQDKKWAEEAFAQSQSAFDKLPVELRSLDLHDPDVVASLSPKLQEIAIDYLGKQQISHRYQDAATNRQVTLVGTTAAIVGTVASGAVIFFSGGAATPAVLAAAALIGGLTTMGVKSVSLGGKYTQDAVIADFASTAIDAIMAGATSGKVIEGLAEKLITKSGLTGPTAAMVITELVKNGAAVPAEVAKMMTDPENWVGTPQQIIARLKTKSLMAAATSARAAATTAGISRVMRFANIPAGTITEEIVEASANSSVQAIYDIDPNGNVGDQVFNFVKGASDAQVLIAANRLGQNLQKAKRPNVKPSANQATRNEDGSIHISVTNNANKAKAEAAVRDAGGEITLDSNSVTEYKVKGTRVTIRAATVEAPAAKKAKASSSKRDTAVEPSQASTKAPVTEVPTAANEPRKTLPTDDSADGDAAFESTLPASFDGVEVNSTVTISPKVRGTSPRELLDALRDTAKAEALAKQLDVSVRQLQQDGAILLSRLRAGKMKSGATTSQQQMSYEAGLLGYSPQKLAQVYRLDSRDPQQIADAGGLQPNPGKDPSTLWEHTKKGVEGGGSYVSTSTEAGNPGTLLNTDFFDDRRTSRGTPLDKVIQGSSTKQDVKDIVYLRYEYQISDTEGVVLDKAAYVKEKEAVIRSATTKQLKFRTIEITQRYIEENSGDASEPRYWYTLTPTKKINAATDVKFGDWQEMPAPKKK